MAVTRSDSKLTPYDEYTSRKRDGANNVDDGLLDGDPDDLADALSEDEQAELEIAKYCLGLLSDGIEARRPWETFDEAWDTLHGELWPAKYPSWKARIGIHKIRSLILFIQAVMTDNKPRVSIEPVVPGSEDAADILNKIIERDWDETDMQAKLSLAVLYGLIWGTGFCKVWYDPTADGGKGAHKTEPIVPYRLYMNRTAKSIEDAEYVVQVEEMTMGWVRRNFPDRAPLVEEFCGARLGSRPRLERDLVLEGTDGETAELDNPIRTDIGNIIPPSVFKAKQKGLADNLIEVAECWYRDDEMEDYERQVVKDGQPQMQDDVDEDGLPVLEVVGSHLTVSPIDGLPVTIPTYRVKQVPKMETAERQKYPNGRLTILAGPVIVRDIPNPYQIDGFPYAEWKCVDFGPVWGQGIPLVLKDIAVGIQRTVSQGYDIVEKTANPSWKYQKGAGLNTDMMKNKVGAIYKLDDLNALQQIPGANMPSGLIELVQMLKGFFGEVAAVQDSMMGSLQGGNVAFATIDQLQESGAAPIRMMVRNLEKMLKRIGTLKIQLTQQFDKGERPLRERVESKPEAITDPETGDVIDVVQPARATEVKFRRYTADQIQGVVEYGVEPDSSLSSSPAGRWNKYMQLLDKKIIDRQAFLEAMRIDDWRNILKRMNEAEMAAAQAKQKQKPGPKPSRPARSGARPNNQKSNVPTRMQNNAVR